MTYLGKIRHGVVVLKDAPQLEEGTQVRVEVESIAVQPPRGSAEAVIRHAGAWADSSAEMDEALEYLRKLKWEDVRRQQAEPEEEL